MKGLEPSDPRPLLAIVAVLVAVAVWRGVSGIEAAGALSSLASLVPFALGAVAIASALAAQRLIATRRALRARAAIAVVPADEFEADIDAVLAFAAQLTRTPRGFFGWLDRRARALRIRLTNDDQGRLVYLLEVPTRAEHLLRTALESFGGLELREPQEVLPQENGLDPIRLRTELVLAHPSIEPLARPSLERDPLLPFAAATGSLEPNDGERVDVCVDLLPASARGRSRLKRRLKRQARRLYRDKPSLRELLNNEREDRRGDPADLFERRQMGKALDQKLREAGPIFEAQFLLCVQAKHSGRAKLAMQSLLAAFEPLSAENWLRASGISVGDSVFVGTDLPGRRARFDRRLATGLFRPSREAILTGRELAGFLKPPTVSCASPHVLRSGTLLPPPPDLPDFDPYRGDLIPLGRIHADGQERVVGISVDDTYFTYIAGRSRYGKTETAIAQFAHLVRSGHGGLFLDPHADALARIRPYLREPSVARRVIEIDLAAGTSASMPGWNLFELGGGGNSSESKVEAVVDAFASTLGWGEQSTRAINLTTQAASALAAIGRVLPPELSPTVFQLPTLLSDDRWRELVLPFLPASSRRFWTDRFLLLAQEAITPVTNLVDRLRHSTPITGLLGQSQSTYRVREAMDRGLIVLASPGSGGTRERMVANLLLFDLLHAARARERLAPTERRPFWVFLDEVQSYDGAASGNLAALLEQSAKFALRAVVLNQNPERLNPQTLTALTTNRSHLLVTALNSHAAALVTKEWAGEPRPAALTKLPRYRFIAQVTHRGEASKPFSLGGITVEDALGPPSEPTEATPDRAVREMSPGDVIDHLETLDERIADELARRIRDGTIDDRPGSKRDGNDRAGRTWLEQ